MAGVVVTRYEVNMELEHPIRCALVSDLHDRDPREVIRILRRMKPDLILVAGDMCERHEKGASPWTVEVMDEWQGISKSRSWFTKTIKALDGSLFPGRSRCTPWDEHNGYLFFHEAAKLAPIVRGLGNHEWYMTKRDLAFMKKRGIMLLDNEDIVLMVNGQELRIGALSTRYDLTWLDGFSKKNGKKILISHHPDYFRKYVKDADAFDLVVSGHTHGGQWRLGSINGRKRGVPVFAPGQGVFPSVAYGRYDKLIVSSGVTNTSRIPRFGNPCEVVYLELK